MTIETKQLLEELGRTRFGKALKEYLEEEKKDLDSVSNITRDFEIEARANKKAVKIIDKLFSFMGEKKVIQKRKPQYE